MDGDKMCPQAKPQNFICSSTMLQELISNKEIEVKEIVKEGKECEEKLEELTSWKQRALSLNSKMKNWNMDFEKEEREGKKAMLFQVIDRIDIFSDRVEIIVNIKMDTQLTPVGDVNCVSLANKGGNINVKTNNRRTLQRR